MAAHSSTLAWQIPWMEGPGRLQSMGSWRVGHDWATSDWLLWSPSSPRDSQESSPAPHFKSINSSAFSLIYDPILTFKCDYWKAIASTIWTFVGKVKSLLFNTLSSFFIAFLPRSKYLLILWLQSPSSDSGTQENKVCQCFHFIPILFVMKWWDQMPWF